MLLYAGAATARRICWRRRQHHLQPAIVDHLDLAIALLLQRMHAACSACMLYAVCKVSLNLGTVSRYPVVLNLGIRLGT